MPLRPPKTPTLPAGYGIAVAAVVLATLVRWPLHSVLGTYVPFVTYFLAVALTAWFAGWKPSLLAIVLGLVAAAYWLVLPSQLARPGAIVIAFTIYCIVCVLVSVLIQGLRFAKDEVEDHSGELQTAQHRVVELNDQLTSELAAMVRLHRVGDDLAQQTDLHAALERIVEAAIDVTHADMGNIQLLDGATGELRIAAFRGFEPRFVNFFNLVHAGQGACGSTLKSGKRVIVEDVATDPIFQGSDAGDEMLAAGARALQATPLVNRSAEMIGVLSTHYRRQRRPSQRDLRLLDLLAQQAGNFIERTRAQSALRESEIRHRDMMEFMPAAVYKCSSEGVIEYYNRRAAELWGRAPQPGETEQQFFGALRLFRTDGAALPYEQTPMVEVLRGGEAIRNREVVLQREDGSRVVVDMNIDPTKDADGRRIGATNVFHDVTAQKKHEEQQALLASIVSSSDDAIVSKSLDGTILSWNIGAERVFGYTAAEMIGQSIMKIIPPERQDEERSILTRIRNGQSIEHFETLRVAKDGRMLDISLTVSPVRDQAGVVKAASKVARDISARKRSEETLRRNEAALSEQNERLQLLGEAAGHVLATDSPDAMVRGLFESVRERLGVDVYFNFLLNRAGDTLNLASHAGISDEVAASFTSVPVGQGISGIVAQVRKPRVATDIQSSNDESVQRVKKLGLRAYACNPLLVGERLLGTLGFGSRSKDSFQEDELELLRTLCHYLAATYERVRLIGELREADRLKDEFLAMLGHELRNPLAAITTGMTLLETDPPRERRDWIGRMVTRQSDQLTRLVDDLLDVSRVSRGKIELRKELVEVSTVVDDALATTRPLIETRRHQVTVDLPSAPIRIEADPVRLAQVVSNLLNNAAKYTKEGGKIWVTARREDSEVILSIRDSGVGITPDLLPRVFDMFVQTDRASSTALGGLGIGLTLARKMTEMHGGRIEARSGGLGQGSEFILYLPAATALEMPDHEAAMQAQNGTTESKKWRILVVDDNEDAAAAISILLQQMGHAVRVAHDGPQALEQVHEHRPEVVLLDIGLPGMDGFEVARRLRQEPDAREAFIVALTGFGQAGHRQRSREAGFNEHLVKPVNMSALRTLLASDPPGKPVTAGNAVD